MKQKQSIELDKFLETSTNKILRLYKKGEINVSLLELLSKLEVQVMQQLFAVHAENQTKAAEFVKMSRTTLLYRIDKYGRRKILGKRKRK